MHIFKVEGKEELIVVGPQVIILSCMMIWENPRSSSLLWGSPLCPMITINE